MRWYCGKNIDTICGMEWSPEKIVPYVMVNPKYLVRIKNPEANIMMDSGAFQDVTGNSRLTFDGALRRQLSLEERGGFKSNFIVSYDRLIDEQNVDGERIKERWTTEAAEAAVEETVEAARFLAARRNDLAPRRLVLSNQGTTIRQYTACMRRVLEVATPEDVIGYGGFCIIGQRQKTLVREEWKYLGMTYPQQFLRILEDTMPMVAAKGIREAHVFGVLVVPILRQAVAIARRYGVDLWTDSASVTQASTRQGRVWIGDGFKQTLPADKRWRGKDVPAEGYWHPLRLAIENTGRAWDCLKEV